MSLKKAIILFLFLAGIIGASGVLAASQSGSLNVNANIPEAEEEEEEEEGGGSPGTNPEKPLPTTILQISPVLGNLAQDCGRVTITWKTELVTTDSNGTTVSDVSATTELGWGINSDSEQVVFGDSGVNHQVVLEDLIIGQEYKYYLKSSDGSYSRKNTGGTFTVYCQLANPELEARPSKKGVELKINYSPDEPEPARIVIRKGIASPPNSPFQGEEVYQGEKIEDFFDSELTQETVQWYSVFVCDENNNCSSGSYDQAQRTIPEVAGLAATPGDSRLNLSWSNPSNNPDHDFNFSEIRIIRPSGDCSAADPGQGAVLAEISNSQFFDLDLENGSQYYYKVFVKNSYGEYSRGICIAGVPTVEPLNYCPRNVSLEAGNQEVAVSWENPSAEEAVLENIYWQRGLTCPAGKNDGRRVYQGLGTGFKDVEVENDSIYRYGSFVDHNGQTDSCGCFAAIPSEAGKTPELCPGCQLSDEHPLVRFLVNGDALEIYPDSENKLAVLAGTRLNVMVVRSLLPKLADLLAVEMNGKKYFLALDNLQNAYQAVFQVPGRSGNYSLTLTTVYRDGTKSVQSWPLRAAPLGKIYFDPLLEKGISGAEITLLDKNQERFFGFGAVNPTISDSRGYYGLMVPNGDYFLEVKKAGYQPKTVPLTIRDNLVNRWIELTGKETLFLKTSEFLRKILDNPKIEEANVKYAAPGAGIIALASTFTGIPWWSFLRYLHYLFTEPFIWLFRRKKKGWGVVYNSITKEPLDLAVVRLYDKNQEKLLKSKVTDRQGRYNFLVDQGEYYLEVGKPKMDFPSEILKNQEEDKRYSDVYTGGIIKIRQGEKGIITANIPLDPEDCRASDREIKRKHFHYNIRRNISVVGPVFSVISFAVSPGWLTAGFLLFHFSLFHLFQRLAEQHNLRNWGIVFNQESTKPINKAIVRIFSPEYDRMLETQITDRHGRYGFFAGNNNYYLTAGKNGYLSFKTDTIDLSEKKGREVVARDIPLQPVSAKARSSGSMISQAAKVSSAVKEKSVVPGVPRKVQKEPSLLEEKAEEIKEREVKKAFDRKKTASRKTSRSGQKLTPLKEDKFG